MPSTIAGAKIVPQKISVLHCTALKNASVVLFFKLLFFVVKVGPDKWCQKLENFIWKLPHSWLDYICEKLHWKFTEISLWNPRKFQFHRPHLCYWAIFKFKDFDENVETIKVPTLFCFYNYSTINVSIFMFLKNLTFSINFLDFTFSNRFSYFFLL